MSEREESKASLDEQLAQALGAWLERQPVPPARGNALRDGTPMLAAFLPRALETLTAGTRRTYSSPLLRLLVFQPCLPLDGSDQTGPSPDCVRLGCTEAGHASMGQVPIDCIVRSDLDRFATSVQLTHRKEVRDRLREERRDALRVQGRQIDAEAIIVIDREIEPSIGASGREGAVSAMKWLFATATGDWLLADPAQGLSKPKRTRTRRRAFTYEELCMVVAVALAGATDPDLVAVTLRFHLLTGARQGEALLASLTDIDIERQTIWIGEKSGRRVEQPLPMSLIIDLHELALARGASAADARILRNRRGQPSSKKLHEGVWANVRCELAFAAAMDAATHCLRKTAATAVERHAGAAVSEAFLRHTAPTLNGIYTGADLTEVATALADLTGEPHPLARRAPQPGAATLIVPELEARATQLS